MSKISLNIFDYTEYRKYLSDYYHFMKEQTSFFSHRYFMNKAQIKSPNFLKNVMEGKRNLSRKSIYKFALALGIDKKETEYFYNMVQFEQSKSSEKKQYYYDRMKLFSRDVVRATITQNRIGYFSKWYYCVVRELIVTRDYQDNWTALGNDVRPRISPYQVKKGVQVLLQLDLIKKNSDGTYSQTSRNITTGNNPVDVMVIRQFHKRTLEHAKHAIDSFPTNERTCTALIMSLTKETYKEMENEIREFRNRITLIANKSNGSDRTYQIGIQLFPVSNVKKK